MSRVVRHCLNFLRASLLVFLVLGMMVQPVLNHIGNLHATEHAQSADTAGNGHDLGQSETRDTSPDPGHPKGAHILMHLAAAGATADIAPTVVLPSAMPLPGYGRRFIAYLRECLLPAS